MTHLTSDELVRWRDEAAPADRERIVGHLAACDSCGAVYAELVRTLPAKNAVGRFTPGDFVERGYRVYRAPRTMAWTVRDWRIWSTAAAAILVVVAGTLWAPSLGRRNERPPVGPEIRGTSIQAVSPVGVVSSPSTFRWSSPVRATTYTLDVRDETDVVVYSTSVREEKAEFPPDLWDRLKPGVRYSWIVTARDRAGDEITRSVPQPFRVGGAAR